MSVSISRFFRDRRLWEVLERLILPELRQICGSRLRVWSAGCACGEEVYSLKLLWEQLLPAPVDSPALDITATDLNPRYLKKAQEALYPLSSLKEVPENLSAAGFRKKPGGKRLEVKPALRGGITWRVHDFFSAPPPGPGFHLIFLRNNLLTYYRAERIRAVLEEIIASLGAGGYLVIGSHEKLPFPPAALQPCPSLAYAFRKTA
jgi:chemotaxis protein methyltransferase CheR